MEVFTHLLASGQEGQGARRACKTACERTGEWVTALEAVSLHEAGSVACRDPLAVGNS